MLKNNICALYREAVVRRCFVKKGVLKNFTKFTGKHLCQSLFTNKVTGLKKRLAQVLPCEFCEMFQNTFFYGSPPVAASVLQLRRKVFRFVKRM